MESDYDYDSDFGKIYGKDAGLQRLVDPLNDSDGCIQRALWTHQISGPSLTPNPGTLKLTGPSHDMVSVKRPLCKSLSFDDNTCKSLVAFGNQFRSAVSEAECLDEPSSEILFKVVMSAIDDDAAYSQLPDQLPESFPAAVADVVNEVKEIVVECQHSCVCSGKAGDHDQFGRLWRACHIAIAPQPLKYAYAHTSQRMYQIDGVKYGRMVPAMNIRHSGKA